MDKPAELFDRDREWADLTRFLRSARPGPALAVVSGRRRQGKSVLLEAAARASGGVYLPAIEATSAEALRLLGQQLGEATGSPGPLAVDSWSQAADLLMTLGADGPRLVVLDELPYLARAAPELPSALQRALGPGRPASRTRLVLCGSSMSFMGGLLSGSAPLRGRASAELLVRPFDFRTAARFWGLSDPALAFRVHAVVGGTPAYRREFVGDDARLTWPIWTTGSYVQCWTPAARSCARGAACWPRTPTCASAGSTPACSLPSRPAGRPAARSPTTSGGPRRTSRTPSPC